MNKYTKNYIILKADSTGELEDLVNEAITQGYVSQGGISVTNKNNEFNFKFVQAMVKLPVVVNQTK